MGAAAARLLLLPLMAHRAPPDFHTPRLDQL